MSAKKYKPVAAIRLLEQRAVEAASRSKTTIETARGLLEQAQVLGEESRKLMARARELLKHK